MQRIALQQYVFSVFSTESRNDIADALLAVGGCEDVVDALLDVFDRVQVAAVLHCLVDLILALEQLSDAAAGSLNWVGRGEGSQAGQGKQSKDSLHFDMAQTFEVYPFTLLLYHC